MAQDSATGLAGPILDIVPSAGALPLALSRASRGPAEVRLPGPRAILNQNDLKCCVSCALAACLESLHVEYPRLAPLFHYVMTVAPDTGPVDLTKAMTPEEGFQTMFRHGISSLALHGFPFRSPEGGTRPDAEAVRDGRGRVVTELDFTTFLRFFEPVGLSGDPVNSCKEFLQKGCPLLFGIHLTANWGAPKLNDPGTRTGGLHAVACLGYSDLEASFIIQDSFGPRHGRGGQWWLPYQCLLSAEPVVFSAHAVGHNLR